jgi:hypothetical protein
MDFNECSNDRCSREVAGGFNPLRLCARCLERYRERGGISRAVGTGDPPLPLGLRRCPLGCNSQRNGETCKASRPRETAVFRCELLDGDFPALGLVPRKGHAA